MPMRRLPPLRALEAFVRVVRLGSARGGGRRAGLSPSALSRRIGNLEEFTGKQAVLALAPGDAADRRGAALLRCGRAAPRGAGDGGRDRSRRTCQLLRLRLGVLPLFGTQRLFPRLPELRKLHPRLHIDIDTGPHLIDRVGDTLDAAIVLIDRARPGVPRGPARPEHASTRSAAARWPRSSGPTPDVDAARPSRPS